VVVVGMKNGKELRFTYELYDEYDRGSGTSSMARTTGFPCVIVARMLAHRRFAEPGVFPPEMLAQRDGVFEFMVDELARRGVVVHTDVREAPE
jgi:saccharopine dehydrogenase-like NADP-dependent oxidoreductase